MVNQSSVSRADSLLLAQSVIQASISPTLGLIGVITNAMSIIIFTIHRHKDLTSTQYLLALAVADFCCCTYETVLQFSYHTMAFLTNGEFYVNLIVVNLAMCKGMRSFLFFAQGVSSWTLCLYSFERCVAIRAPLVVSKWFTPNRRAKAIVGVYIMNVAFAMKSLVTFEIFLTRGIKECYVNPNSSPLFYFLSSAIELGFILALPGCLILVLNLSLCLALYQRSKVKSTLSTQTSGLSKSELRCMVTLISISALYLVAVTPSIVSWTVFDAMQLISYYSTPLNVDWKFYFHLAKLCDSLLVVNFAGNFLVYSASIDWYRSAVKSCLCMGRGKAKPRPRESLSSKAA